MVVHMILLFAHFGGTETDKQLRIEKVYVSFGGLMNTSAFICLRNEFGL